MADSETFENLDDLVEENTKARKSKRGGEGCSWGSYFRILAIIFVMFLFVSSDVFIDKILSQVSGAVEYKTPTTRGTFIQALVLTLLVMMIDLILSSGLF
jgi:hypothetical protein